MRLLFPLSSDALRNRTVVFDDGELERAALLPFFDAGGAVRRVVAFERGGASAFAFDPQAVRTEGRWWRKLAIVGEVRRLRWENARELQGLWCFDPHATWADSRLTREWTDLLAAANGFGKLRTRRKNYEAFRVYYRRNLTRAIWAAYGTKSQQQLIRFSNCTLPTPNLASSTPATASEPPATSRRAWRLEPFWTALTRETDA